MKKRKRKRQRQRQTERKLKLSPDSESLVFYQLGPQIESRFCIPFTVVSGNVRNKVTKRVIFMFLCYRERERERERTES